MKKTRVFTDDDYISGDGMLTYIWGPSLWHSLHTVSFNYPVKPTREQKEQYLTFFKSVGTILPCSYCRDNFKKNLKKVPLTMGTMKNRHSFSLWFYELHEEINKMLGKKSNLSYEDVRDRYEHFRARCLKPSKTKIKSKKEKGCTNPLYGVKSKCVISIVPKTKKCKTFNIDRSCKLKKCK
jgi:hypothetical protein